MFLHVSVILFTGGGVSQHALQAVSQHALQRGCLLWGVPAPRGGAFSRGEGVPAWGGACLGRCLLRGGVSGVPALGGVPAPRGGMKTPRKAERRLLLRTGMPGYWNAFLFSSYVYVNRKIILTFTQYKYQY